MMARAQVPLESKTEQRALLALHGSAGAGSQWLRLAQHLGDSTRMIAPDLWGYGAAPMWESARPLRLADEAARAVRAIAGRGQEPFDLVGHSYGGAVALHIARRYPHRVRSLVLIEPVAFHLLATPPGSARCREALAEVRAVSGAVGDAVRAGLPHAGMAGFIDYWNGAGAWERLPLAARESLAAKLPKVALDFAAAFAEPGGFEALRDVRCPVLLLRGTQSPRPVRLIAELLAGSIPRAELATLGDAGHMLPLTHPHLCNELVEWHINGAGRVCPDHAA
jgi:pimeloyl-ACP methyl ester carboxylesterase